MPRTRNVNIALGLFIAAWIGVAFYYIIKKQPDFYKDAFTYYNEAKALAEGGKPAEAALVMDKVVAKEPKNIDYLRYKGFLEVDAKQPDKALETFSMVLAQNPKDGQSALASASILISQGKNDLAATMLKATAQASLTDDDRLIRGKMLAQLNQHPEALVDFEYMAPKRPADAELQKDWASSYMAVQRYKDALPILQNLAQVDDPKVREWARMNLPIALRAEGKLVEAKKELAQSSAPDSKRIQAEIALQLERYAEAVDLYTQWLKENPNDVAARGAFGYALEKAGKPDLAAKEFELVMKSGQADQTTKERYVWALMGQKRFEEAYSVLTGMKTDNRPDLLRLTAEVGFLAGKNQEAVEQFRKLAEKYPGDPLLWKNLGDSLDALGRTEEAAVSYEKYLALKPGDLKAQRKLAWMWTRLGRQQNAERLYKELAQKPEVTQNDPTFWKEYGDAMDALKKTDDAAAAYQKALAANPDDVEAQRRVAVMLLRSKKDREAQAAFESILAKTPGDMAALSGLADIHEMRGEHAKAAGYAERLVAANPDHAPGYYRVARINAWRKNFKASRTWFERYFAKAAGKVEPKARLEYANVLVELGEGDKALALYGQNLPGDVAGLRTYARASIEAKKPQQAVAAYEKRKTQKALTDEDVFLYAGQLRLLGKRDAALAMFKTLPETGPRAAETAEAIGDLLMDQGRGAEALAMYKRIPESKLTPKQYLKIGRAADKAKDRVAARAAYEKFAQVEPEEPELILETARFFTNSGRTEKAQRLYDKYIAKVSEKGLWLELALANLAAKRYQTAEKWAREAIANNDGGFKAQLALVQALHLGGKSNEAFDILMKNKDTFTATSEGREWIGYVAAARNNHLEAYNLFDELTQTGHGSPGQMYMWRGIAAQRRGDFGRAAKSFAKAKEYGVDPDQMMRTQ